MRIIPAVNLKQGRCVQITQGRMEKTTHYSDHPVKVVEKWIDSGADLIHIIDLDGAFAREVKNSDSIKNILEETGVPVQVGGGIRDLDTIKMYFELGVERIIIGSEAVYNPELVKDASTLYPDKIMVSLGARNGMVAVEGWSKTSKTKAVDLAKEFEHCGVAAVIFTDIHRDGTRSGPNCEEIATIADTVSIPVIASGGVSNIIDVKNLLEIESKGVSGVIIGRALYEGSLDLKEAIRISK